MVLSANRIVRLSPRETVLYIGKVTTHVLSVCLLNQVSPLTVVGHSARKVVRATVSDFVVERGMLRLGAG